MLRTLADRAHSTVARAADGLAGVARRLLGGESNGDWASERRHAARDDDVVVFVVGMRINELRKVHRWLPVFFAGPRLVRRLREDPDSGLLGSWTFVSPPRTVGFVQYWESFDALGEYARDPDRAHRDAWREFQSRSRTGAVGIWHETYAVAAHETVYNGVPPRGLGAAEGSDLVPATGRRRSARGRFSESESASASTDEPRSPF